MPIFTAASIPGSIAALSFLFSTTSSSSSSSVHYSSMLAPTNANSRIAHKSRHSVLAGKVSLSDNPKAEKPNQTATTTAAPVAASTGAAEDSPDSVWQDRIYADWKAARVYLDTGCIYQGRVEGHNGGGLRIRFYSLLGFLPFPQLSPSHSCKAPQKAIHEIAKGLAGSLISMKVIQVEEESRKLIFSEKEAAWSRFSKSINVGDVFSGMVGAVEDFGAFVHLRLPDGLYHLTGLVHVSEVSWDLVQDVRDILREGDKVRVKVINVDRQKSRINLSIKQLEEDPLLETLEKVIPQDGSVGPDTLRTGDSTIIDPLPGLEAIFQELLRENGIDDIRISRQGFEKRVVSQDLQLWLSNAPPTNKKFTLLARAGRQVQEIQLRTTLDQEGIKKALQRALERVP